MSAVKTFADGSYLEFGWGGFDEWCVYYVSPQGQREPPKDVDYFRALANYAQKYGAQKLYSDFVAVYDRTTGSECRPEVNREISDIAATYRSEDSLRIDKIFSILYMAMIAEQNKKGTRLGKRIKRLGVHVLLWENATPEYAANCMKGLPWKTIDGWCHERGF